MQLQLSSVRVIFNFGQPPVNNPRLGMGLCVRLGMGSVQGMGSVHSVRIWVSCQVYADSYNDL